MNLESKLSTIIEAQCRVGCMRNKFYLKLMERDVKFVSSDNVIAILLQPEALKAAHGEFPSSMAEGIFKEGDFHLQKVIPRWQTHAHRILDSWLSSGAEGAINTAYELLPKV